MKVFGSDVNVITMCLLEASLKHINSISYFEVCRQAKCRQKLTEFWGRMKIGSHILMEVTSRIIYILYRIMLG
jgi:hypothetical protein